MLDSKFNISLIEFNKLSYNEQLVLVSELESIRDETYKHIKRFRTIMPNSYKLKKDGTIWKRNGIPVKNKSVK